tara:strand:+ start:43 stop:285 length:243 start_codon:yes stop_codon:yes gene_type:complete
MNNYKITNLSNNKSYFLNESEKETFFKINYLYKDGGYQYKIENLTESKKQRIDKALNFLTYVCLVAVSILTTVLYIQSYC